MRLLLFKKVWSSRMSELKLGQMKWKVEMTGKKLHYNYKGDKENAKDV